MSKLDIVVRGDNRRTSRLHDEKGNMVDLRGLLYAPQAMIGTILRMSIGYRPILPWISFRAIHYLETRTVKDWRVLEYGSGMSTVWFARRCGYVMSIEHNEAWHKKVRLMIEREGLSNVRLEHRSAADYASVSGLDERSFDLVLIDGAVRSRCVVSALTLVKPGGCIYLDNSDKDSGATGGDMRYAEESLLRAASERDAAVHYFTDFAPCQPVPNQGLLVEFRGR